MSQSTMSLATLMPFIYRMSGYFYLVSALILSLIFCAYGCFLWRQYSTS